MGHIARNHGIMPPTRLEKPSPPGVDLGVIRDFIMLGAGGGNAFVEEASSPPIVLTLVGGLIEVIRAAPL